MKANPRHILARSLIALLLLQQGVTAYAMSFAGDGAVADARDAVTLATATSEADSTDCHGATSATEEQRHDECDTGCDSCAACFVYLTSLGVNVTQLRPADEESLFHAAALALRAPDNPYRPPSSL